MQRPWGKEGVAGVEFRLTSNRKRTLGWGKGAELARPGLPGSEKVPRTDMYAHQGLPARWGGGSSK